MPYYGEVISLVPCVVAICNIICRVCGNQFQQVCMFLTDKLVRRPGDRSNNCHGNLTKKWLNALRKQNLFSMHRINGDFVLWRVISVNAWIRLSTISGNVFAVWEIQHPVIWIEKYYSSWISFSDFHFSCFTSQWRDLLKRSWNSSWIPSLNPAMNFSTRSLAAFWPEAKRVQYFLGKDWMNAFY